MTGRFYSPLTGRAPSRGPGRDRPASRSAAERHRRPLHLAALAVLGLILPALDGVALPQAPAGDADWEAEFAERLRHWSFQPVEAVVPPAVAGLAPDAGPIDAFVRRRLAAAGLASAPPADRRTLARRLAFDLTGLPPSPEEVEAFVADPSPDAYERLVERLLASPHFGEKWARHWLDLVRYADTRGHEFDYPIPNAYQYRDYVIRAFNADVPYDRFLVEHVAGDLLDEPRRNPATGADESVLGTGFWFLGEEVHSPVDIRADEVDRTANKIDVLGKAFLGLTVACARCHDHEFDPISTEDYYALAGFPLSAGYRQVRFETIEHNGRVARALDAVERELGPAVKRTVGQELERDLDGFAAELLAAAEVLRLGPREVLATDVLPAAGDLLFEDFEGASYGAWAATGTAFGDGPVRVDELPAYQGDVRARGDGLVNSHHARSGETVRDADAHLGTLTSPLFVIERDHVHFLIGGGSDRERTCVQLLVDDQVVRSACGRDDNRMQPERFDVSDLRGREAVLRVVDAHDGGWGNVGLDQVVFSDDPGSAALDIQRRPPAEAGLAARVDEVAQQRGRDAQRLARCVSLLDRQRAADPLRRFAELALPTAPGTAPPAAPCPPDALELPAGARVIADYRHRDAPWLQDGFTFGPRPVERGGARFGTDPEHPLAAVHPHSAAEADPLWESLELAAGTERDPSKLDWVQSGRTLRTPTFTLQEGRLFYLVRGAGHAYAAIDQHRMIHGPLHGALLATWESESEYRWIEHDLRDYAGHRAHVELTPREREAGSDAPPLALLLVVESSTPPAAPEAGESPILRRLAEAATAEELARELETALRNAARGLARGGTADALGDPGLPALADWLVRQPELPLGDPARAAIRAAAAELVERRAALVAEIRRVSATAPAVLEGSGVDERVLIRGNPATPGEPARRRFLSAIAGSDQAPVGAGSGRLELAWRLTDPANPFPARVLANRVWHHLFGRGLVPTVDDFGHMGEPPSHPELLDWLAGELVRQGWSLKSLVRTVVLSETYRQASTADPRALEIDPQNRLMHHTAVRRLPAEAIRDAILAVCGRLDSTLCGPSVRVYLTEFMSGRGRPAKSGPLDGNGRRSIYLAVRRNFLVPMLQVFDFPAPASTMGRRSVSNVPAQALTLMNDPFVVQQSERWGRRVLALPGLDDEARVDRLYREAFARPAAPAEVAQALEFLATQRSLHTGVADEADGVRASSAEERAWADLCHVLFNLKEFVFLS